VRLEAIREGVQECEARVFIEKALDTARAQLGEGLAARAEAALDERIRLARLFHFSTLGFLLSYPGSGWQARSETLYALAAEVEQALR
jgi:hypothetical protein